MQAICCGHCSWLVPEKHWHDAGNVQCPVCRRGISIKVFPAILGATAGALPEAVSAETEASCFYHPQNRAAVPCDECGRFLCKLCDLELDGRHLCPACFQAGTATRRLPSMEQRRTMYDTLALTLATFPALLLWPAILTAPSALCIIVRRWRSPASLVPRTRIRFYLAGIFALAEIAAIVVLAWAVLRAPSFTAGH